VGILDKFGNDVKSLTVIPSSGGAYNILKNDEPIFSKQKEGRFPFSDDEVINLLG